MLRRIHLLRHRLGWWPKNVETWNSWNQNKKKNNLHIYWGLISLNLKTVILGYIFLFLFHFFGWKKQEIGWFYIINHIYYHFGLSLYLCLKAITILMVMHYLSIEKNFHLYNPTSLSYYLSVVQSIRLPVDSTFKRIKKYNAISFFSSVWS